MQSQQQQYYQNLNSEIERINKKATIMHSKRIGSIIINDTGNKTTPYGIFTGRDLLAKISNRKD
jgi:predicted transcriptional regulator